MKKPKISLDAAKIQALLLNHIEKILLVVVLGLTLLLIWQGYGQPGLEPGKTPQGLINDSQSMMSFIDDPNRWTEVSATRPVPPPVTNQVAIGQAPTDPAQYFLPNTLSRPDFPKLSPRTDPKLFAPINLIVHAVIGAIASPVKDLTETDPLLPPESEESLRAKRLKAKNEAEKKARMDKKGQTSPDAGGMMGEGMPGGGRPKRGKKGSTDALGDTAMMTPSPGGMGEYGMSGMPGAVYPEAMMYGYQVQNIETTIARNTYAMVVTAVVPYQKQIDEFMNTLSNSLDYDPARDFPQYLQFWVERAEVPADKLAAGPDELAWTQLKVNATLMEQLGNEQAPGLWAGAPPEVVDPNYVDSVLQGGKLTHPCPPFLARNLWPLLTHPDVPLATAQYGYGGEGSPGAVPGAPGTTSPGNKPATPTDDVPTVGIGPAGGFGGGMNPGGLSGEGGGGARFGGFSGGGFGGGGFGGFGGGGYGGMPGGGGTAGMGGGYTPRPGGFGGTAGMGGGYSGSSDGGYGSGYGAQQMVAPPKFKMVRFTDTTVALGRKYRYRLKVLLHDPNHPMVGDPARQIPGYNAPSVASLHSDVLKRIKALDEADTAGKRPRTVYVTSDWSEPSAVVGLPAPSRVLAMAVHPAPATQVLVARDRPPVMVPNDQPRAQALALAWDRNKVADIPAEVDRVFRGMVLNVVQDVKVIHPVTKMPVPLTKYAVVTDALIADMMGGERIPTLDKSVSLTAPGELLVIDPLGNMHVHNETDDLEEYRRFAVPKEVKQPATGDAGLSGGTAGEGAPARRGRAGCF